MDFMVTDAPTQLPFYSRLQTNDTAGVSVLSHIVSNVPGPPQKCLANASHICP